MKRILLIIFCTFCSFYAHSQLDKVDLGIGTTIEFSNPTFGGQAKAIYFVNDWFHPSFTYTYYIRKNVNYALDFDARFTLFSFEEYYFSPLGGINVARLNGDTRVAFNAGLFVRIDRDIFDIYLEPKVVLDDFTYFVLSGGLYF